MFFRDSDMSATDLFFLKFHINAKKQLNSAIRFIAYTDAITNDLDTSNNRDTLDLKTVAAIDPNLKESYPDGFVKNPVSKIKYHIQFQNEGLHSHLK